MVLCLQRDVGVLNPAFTAGQAAILEIIPRAGNLKRLDFFFSGDHATAITTGQIDGETNTIKTFRLTAPMLDGPNIIWDMLPRDLKFITAILEGSLSEHLNPAGDGTFHTGRFSVLFAPPKRLVANPDDWGLNTADLSGPIRIEIVYGPVTSIGTGATAITQKTRVSECVEPIVGGIGPAFTLVGQQNRLSHTNDAAEEDTVGTGNMERISHLFLRQHDDSALAAQRVDTLIARVKTRHRGTEIADELWQALKQRTQQAFQFDRADYPVGIAIQQFVDDFNPASMLPTAGGRTLMVIHDSTDDFPDHITKLTPATNDALYVNVLGMNFTRAGRSA